MSNGITGLWSHSIGHLHPRVQFSDWSGTFFVLLKYVLCLFQKSFFSPFPQVVLLFLIFVCLYVNLGLVGVYGKQMSFSVEHPPIQIHLKSNIFRVTLLLWIPNILCHNHLMPVRKEEVEVLEGLPQEERLHHVPRPRVQRVPHLVNSKSEHLKILLKGHKVSHIADGGVASWHLGIGLNPLQMMTSQKLLSSNTWQLLSTWKICQPQSWYVLLLEK